MTFNSVRDILLAHRDAPETAARPAILFEDEVWTYREYVNESIVWANALAEQHDENRPFHVGALLDNGTAYCLALGATALLGAALVGINPTRRGAELARDISHTDCEIILTESRHLEMLTDALGGASASSHSPSLVATADSSASSHLGVKIFCVDKGETGARDKAGAGSSGVLDWQELVQEVKTAQTDRHSPSDPPPPDPPPPNIEVNPTAPYLLLFTSGTTGAPKAAICSQARLAGIAQIICETHELTSEDVFYQAMPMFHSNALMAGWAPCLAAGATGAFRRRFSASGWLGDIRKFGATYFNYVGKPLTYILATPETPEDKDHKLRRVFGNEGAVHDLKRFEERFGIPAHDSYGSTEGGLGISRTPETPPAALGMGDEFTKILDPETGDECPLADFDETGKLTNPEAATGELVHLKSSATFEGYWNNPEADHERTHSDIYWSGDLGYKDADGYIYFAGRSYDWLRVDGENFAAAPVERILVRHPDVDLAAVYAVPNPDTGDDVMAAVIRRSGADFSPQDFMEFLKSQPDMGIKWIPRYIRWSDDLPKTPSMKILKRVLREQLWEADDEIWILDAAAKDDTAPAPAPAYRRITDADKAQIRETFAARDRASLLPA